MTRIKSGAKPPQSKARFARKTFVPIRVNSCLMFRIYREMLVLQTLGHDFGLLRLDLFGRGVQ